MDVKWLCGTAGSERIGQIQAILAVTCWKVIRTLWQHSKIYYEFHQLGSGRETGCSTRSCGETSHTAAGELPEEWLTTLPCWLKFDDSRFTVYNYNIIIILSVSVYYLLLIALAALVSLPYHNNKLRWKSTWRALDWTPIWHRIPGTGKCPPQNVHVRETCLLAIAPVKDRLPGL